MQCMSGKPVRTSALRTIQRSDLPPARTLPAQVVGQFICFSLFPGHALHEKGLERQMGDGKPVNSQEQRALLILLINCG